MKKSIFYFLFIGLFFAVGCTIKTNVMTQPKTTVSRISVETTTPKTPSPAPTTTPKKETTLRKITQEKGLVYYEGKIIVSGKYTLYPPDDPFLSGLVCFHADENTGYLIPREKQLWGGAELQLDSRDPWFCLSNKEAPTMLGIPQEATCETGTATIEVSNYIVTLWETETYDRAKLERVITKEKALSGCITTTTKIINWCQNQEAAPIDENRLWISSQYFNGMGHAPTIRHLCRGEKELFYLEMDWNAAVSVHTGKLIAINSSSVFLITSTHVDPELSLLEVQNKQHPNLVWLSIDGQTVVYDETSSKFSKYPKE